MEMTLFGEKIPASQALEWGLINRVVPDDQLMSEAQAYAQRLADGPTQALALIRDLVWQAEDNDFDSQLQARIDGYLPEGNLPTETAETTPNAGTSITRTTTLQETAIDRVAPVAPAADSSAVTDRPQSAPVVDTEASEEADAVRALW